MREQQRQGLLTGTAPPKTVPKPTRALGRDRPQQSADPERSRGVSGAAVKTVAKRPRRLFSAANKLQLVKIADACLASGECGLLEALLRREGIYSSQLSSWRTQLNVQLMKRNAEFDRKLQMANVLIALQKKAERDEEP